MHTIDTKSLATALGSNRAPAVIDVLPAREHERGHIPRSVNIPLQAGFADNAMRLLVDKERPVVVYSAGPDCDASARAAAELQAVGFQAVFDYEGGVQAWQQAGHSMSLPTPRQDS